MNGILANSTTVIATASSDPLSASLSLSANAAYTAINALFLLQLRKVCQRERQRKTIGPLEQQSHLFRLKKKKKPYEMFTSDDDWTDGQKAVDGSDIKYVL